MSRRVHVAGAALFTIAVASLTVVLTEIGAPHGNAGIVAAGVRLVGMVLLVILGTPGDGPDAGTGPVGAPPDRNRQRCHAAERHGRHRAHRLPAGLTSRASWDARHWSRALRRPRWCSAGRSEPRSGPGTSPGLACAHASLRRRSPAPGWPGFVALRPDSLPAAAGGARPFGPRGMGFSSTAAIVIVQGSVGWAERGVATVSNIFSRILAARWVRPCWAVSSTFLWRMWAWRPSGRTRFGSCSISLAAAPGGDAAVRAALHEALASHLLGPGVLLLHGAHLSPRHARRPPVAASHGPRELAPAD